MTVISWLACLLTYAGAIGILVLIIMETIKLWKR